MGRVALNMSYLSIEVEVGAEEDLQKRLLAALYSFQKVQDLGYYNGHQLK